MVKKTKSKNLGTSDYEKLGRTLESIFEGGYINHRRVYKINFIRGLFFGLGSVIGGTIIIASILWVLSFFSQVPLIGHFVDNIQTTVEK